MDEKRERQRLIRGLTAARANNNPQQEQAILQRSMTLGEPPPYQPNRRYELFYFNANNKKNYAPKLTVFIQFF